MHYLFVLLAVLLAGVVSAAVVYDIPRLRGVTVDGNSADWKEQGLRVDVLYEGRGMPRLDAVENARLRLGWDEQGLLVFATVMDSSVTEESRLDWLWSRDALEFYLANKVGGKDLVQLVIAPGVDPHTPNPRFRAYDNRKSPALKDTPITCEIGRSVIAGGYCLELRIPWSTLGVTPEVGREFGFSTMVDLYDNTSGSLRILTWYPKIGAFANSKLLQCLRLAETAGAPVQSVAYADYEHFRRAVVSVFGSAELVGRHVVAQEGKKTVGTGVMVADTHGSHGTVLLPLSTARKSFKALTVCVAGQYVLPLTLPDLDVKRQQAVENAHFVFSPSVFSGETFPAGDFDDPALLDVLLGHYTVHISYYNAACVPVMKATTPGRYGAVVTITGEGGITLTRNCTLYRLPEKADLIGKSTKTPNDAGDMLSPTIGISPVVLHEQMQMVDDFTHDALREKLTRDSAGATFLTWLAETPPGSPAARTLVVEDRLDAMMATPPERADARWWTKQQVTNGTLVPYPHADYLPEQYDEQPDQHWPLVVMLHGSGATAASSAAWHSAVAKCPLVQRAKKDFPCIVVIPLCPLTEWWSPSKLMVMLDELSSRYRIDTHRVYLTGYSMGGLGTLATAMEYPERFAAIAPICGFGDITQIANLKEVPMWAFHGENDPTVPLKHSERLVDALKALGDEVKFTVYPNQGHGVWDTAFNEPELFNWFFQHVKKD